MRKQQCIVALLGLLIVVQSVVQSEALADYAATVLEDNPVAYYRFEEPEGADEIADSSGANHVGYEVLDVEFGREGIAGSRAAEFLGISSIVLDFSMNPADPEGDGIGTGNDDFTIEAWVYTTGVEDDPNNPGEVVVANQQVFVAQKDGSGLGRSDALVTANQQLGSYLGGDTTNAFDPLDVDPMEVETWFHFVMAVDGGDQEIYYYINGEESELNSQFAGANGVESADGDWVIGSHKNQAGQFFTGLLDEVAFYNYRLDDPDGNDNTNDSRVLAHFEAASGGGGAAGDFDGDGLLTADDINRLSTAVRDGSTDSIFDVSGDGVVDDDDRRVWVQDLKNTYFGDANLDGEFNTGDLVTVLASGLYEIDVDSLWESGDFDGNGRTNTGDLVAALAGGGYEAGPKAAVIASVPEPTGFVLSLVGLLGLLRFGRRHH